jgi:pilus assembly protein Flp/PilA
VEKSKNPEEVLGNDLYRKGFIMLFSSQEKGQGLVEYAIIIAFVAILVIVIVRLLGTNVGSTYSTISSSIP